MACRGGRSGARGARYAADRLSREDALGRLAKGGPNLTSGRAGERAHTVLVRQLANPLIAVLLVSGAVPVAAASGA